jgi:hypothetical protein
VTQLASAPMGLKAAQSARLLHSLLETPSPLQVNRHLPQRSHPRHPFICFLLPEGIFFSDLPRMRPGVRSDSWVDDWNSFRVVWIPIRFINASSRRQPRSARSRSTPATGPRMRSHCTCSRPTPPPGIGRALRVTFWTEPSNTSDLAPPLAPLWNRSTGR